MVVVDLTVVVVVEETVVDAAGTEVDAAETGTLEAQDRVTGSAPTQTVETTTLLGVTSATDARLPSLMEMMAQMVSPILVEMMTDSVAADVVVEETVVASEDVVIHLVGVVDSVADPQWADVAWTGADVEVAEAEVAQTEWTTVWTEETDPINLRRMYSWLPRTNRILLIKLKDSGGSKSAQIDIDVIISACLKEDSSSAVSPWPSSILI